MKNDPRSGQNLPALDAAVLGQQTLVNALQVFTSWMNTTNELQTETNRFMIERLKKHMQMPAKLAACGSALDVYQEQVEFASTMVEDYAEESQKIAGVLSDALDHDPSQLTVIRP